MKKILFQGDSITDAARSKENDFYLGSGYVNIVSGILGAKYPEKFSFINRGINGNKITNLYLRMEKDIINISPDYLSILIGVNDVWHELEINDGVSEEKFEKVYCQMLEEILKALPNVKVFILEPFILHGSATNKEWVYFRKEVEKRACVAKKVAEKFNAIFIPLQKKFDDVQKICESEEYWLRDGVHPTASGSYLISEEWIKFFEKEI